jgi:hypothetical protein
MPGMKKAKGYKKGGAIKSSKYKKKGGSKKRENCSGSNPIFPKASALNSSQERGFPLGLSLPPLQTV